ncbi:sugar ABC transporter ATP-binding protein [Rubellimicrobium aerolatum]|uniref:Sugar ABC transporter ATP-binding protein n=1 Tax=Rubellimicrobium aerolatum TaxID=490979 RepID=A0ABW0SCD9_9RHOB|nr:sugar ABC transporter ATP-binding protein [Rubellimicrobium aerolatum]MBP1806278.1 ribose transport system ATP-binding protein [Rubellimicrobium aerolatum]
MTLVDLAAPDRLPGSGKHPAEVLRMENVRMRFGPVEVLKGVSLGLRRKEILGLLGANGSGKSTLIKVLAGFNSPEPESRVRLWGDDLPLPLDAALIRRKGVAFVHQHLGLIPSLRVIDNMILSNDRLHPLGIAWGREARRLRGLFAEFGLAIDPLAPVESLAPVQRAFVAIVRAFDDLRRSEAGRAGEGVLVLDEPTPFLSGEDVEKLFALLRGIRATGASVIIVTHDIDEVLAITDRVAVMRDGRLAAMMTTAETTRQEILDAIVGRAVETFRRPSRPAPTGVAARLAGIAGGQLDPFDLTLAPGEVVGVTGLIGSGFADVPYLAFGAAPGTGRVEIGGQALDVARLTPARAVAAGMGLIPGDRLHQSCIVALSVTDNATMLALPRLRRGPALDRAAMTRATEALVAAHDVRPPRPGHLLGALSGGNQQKVVLGKWLAEEPRLLLLDEPTQGVDFGARQQIFAAIDAAAARGTAVLCASTDAEQLSQICDRVIVFAKGRPVAELTGAQVEKSVIARTCFLGVPPAPAPSPSLQEGLA